MPSPKGVGTRGNEKRVKNFVSGLYEPSDVNQSEPYFQMKTKQLFLYGVFFRGWGGMKERKLKSLRT